MSDARIYPCSIPGMCSMYVCMNPTKYLIARHDVAFSIAVNTGIRVCEDCAKSIASKIPLELLVGLNIDVEARVREAVTAQLTEELQVANKAEIEMLTAEYEMRLQTLVLQLEEAKRFIPAAADPSPEPGEKLEPVPGDVIVLEDDEDDPDQVHRCLECNQEFETKRQLNSHMGKHKKEKLAAERG